MTQNCGSALVAFCLGMLVGVGGTVWLGLWADERNQRFYQANEPRNWVG